MGNFLDLEIDCVNQVTVPRLVNSMNHHGVQLHQFFLPCLARNSNSEPLISQGQGATPESQVLSHDLRPQFIEKDQCSLLIRGNPAQKIRENRTKIFHFGILQGSRTPTLVELLVSFTGAGLAVILWYFRTALVKRPESIDLTSLIWPGFVCSHTRFWPLGRC